MTKNPDFRLEMRSTKSPQQIFAAILDVRSWWSQNIEGPTDKLEGVFHYHYKDEHLASFRITTCIANKKIVWFVEDNHFKFTKDQNEWKGTEIIFEIKQEKSHSLIEFTHKGLNPEFECYAVCRDAWTHYLKQSLLDLIEKGAGDPTPKEVEIPSLTPDSRTHTDKFKSPGVGIYHRLIIGAAVETVYQAITTQQGLSQWWTPSVKAEAKLGSIARFEFGPEQFIEMQITQLEPYNKVKWNCRQAHAEWASTTVSFELTPHPKGTVLSFAHENWQQYSTELAGCSYTWALFLRSLKKLCETGEGQPFPNQAK